MTCPSCGRELPGEFPYCPFCGSALAAAPYRAPSEERKVVTVLFCDLVGFTAQAERLDAEDVRALLSPYHVYVRSELERFGGTVEKFIGDAVMALFGAPVAHEDDPERAVRAALAIRDWVSEQREELQARIAVNTGEVLVTLGARPSEGESMAAGDVVNTAARLQAAAPVNGVLVGAQTYRATAHVIDYRDAEPVVGKGKSEPIRVWEALEARSRLGLDVSQRPLAPLVGRARELELLVSTLARVREERSPQLVTLVGVPGIGKSRLVFELFRTVEQDAALVNWRQGRSLPYGEGVTFWALSEIVKAQAGILESDAVEQAALKLRRAIEQVVSDASEARWVERHLRPLAGLADERPGTPDEGFAAWRLFFETLADERPLILVLEDLHWADDALLEFVDHLIARATSVPLLVVGTARPEFLARRPGWGGGQPNALTISLPPLSDDETGQVVAAALAQPELQTDVHTALLARAAGNPLYAEQFARILLEGGDVSELPETVQGIVAARLDALSAEEKRLLHDAAVVGKVFWLGAVEAVDGVTRWRAEELLFALERKEFVQRARRVSVAGEAQYAFRHVLLRDVAYGQIPRGARSEKHQRAAAWIESLGRPEDHAEMLAHHYLSALEYGKAAGREDPALVERARLALRAAADRASSLASHAAAARFYHAALEVWPRNDPDRVWLLVHGGRASHAADGTGFDLLREGFEELQARGDVEGAAEVAVELSRCFWFVGDRDEAYAYIDRALDLAGGSGHSRARAHALVERAAYHMNASEHRQGARLAREALPLTEALGTHDLRVRALDVLGFTRVLLGDAGGIADMRRAIELARESNIFSRLIVAEWNLYHAQFFLAQLAAASKTARMVRRDIETYGSADMRRALPSLEAHNAVLNGRWEEGARILDQVVAEADTGAAHYVDPSCRALRAWIGLARGEFEAADADSATAVERARRTKDPQVLAPALVSRAIVLLAAGRTEDASTLAAEVLAGESVLITALVEWLPTPTPIDFAWLLRDLGRELELLPALEATPATPWIEAARAIAYGNLARGLEIVVGIGSPPVEAYTRLRAAEELARAGRHAEAHDHAKRALVFFRKVGAIRYIQRAEGLLAVSA